MPKLGPPEDTATRQRRLVEERQGQGQAQDRVTTVADMFGAPDGSDDRVYSADGNMEVLDDGLTEAQRDIFHEELDHVDNDDVIDLGQGGFPNVESQPPPAKRVRETRPAKAEAVAPAEFEPKEPYLNPKDYPGLEGSQREVVTRPAQDPLKRFVDVLALDDWDVTVGYNEGKIFSLKRNKIHRVPEYVARHLADKHLVTRPQQPW